MRNGRHEEVYKSTCCHTVKRCWQELNTCSVALIHSQRGKHEGREAGQSEACPWALLPQGGQKQGKAQLSAPTTSEYFSIVFKKKW